MDTLLPVQSNTFYQRLKKCEGLDLRDNRGKVHCVALVLMGVFIGLYRNRDGVLSSIHRCLKNTHSRLCAHLGLDYTAPVSRAQLPIVLKKIETCSFSKLLFDFLGLVLSTEEKQWFSADGKELRGSMAKGEKRGEAVVQILGQHNGQVYEQAFYNGRKESERPCLQQLLQRGMVGQKITLDALHLIPETVEKIADAQGIYLVGVKENQKELYNYMVTIGQSQRPLNEFSEIEKSHGRIDKRTYKSYGIGDEFFDERWQDAHFQTLVQVQRTSLNCHTKAESHEVSYYISNALIKEGHDYELFRAVRGHWNIETHNYIRDVTFKEDQLKTKEPVISKVMACCRTMALNLLNQLRLKNRKEKLEEFADNFDALIKWMTQIKLL